MHLAVGNANERGDVAAQVEQGVHLHRTLVLAETGPREHRQAKINRRRIQCIQGLNEIHAERVVRIQRPCNGNQHEGEVGIDAPIVRLVGIAQRGAGLCARGSPCGTTYCAWRPGRLRCREDSRDRSTAQRL